MVEEERMMIKVKEGENTFEIDGLNLHLIPSKAYKTITIVAKFKAPLDRKTITNRVLLPSILRQGSKLYPTREDLQFKLDDLYGASLSLDGSKAGNDHVINVRMEIANQKYINNELSIIDNAVTLLNEVIFNPNVTDDAFPVSVLNREKETLQQQIRSIIDNKDSFAQQRLIDEMCEGELYQVHGYGYEEDLSEITAESLYDYYKTLLIEDDLDIYILGDFDNEAVKETIKQTVSREKQPVSNDSKVVENVKVKARDEVQEIIEIQDVQQAKLHLGYRTGITYNDDDFASLMIFNGLFGGYPGSKLFINVREKNSLAYNVMSGNEAYNGYIFVTCGIAPSDYKKARTIIDEQVQAMQNGDFTEEEVTELKDLLVSQLLEAMDNAQNLIELMYQNLLGGKSDGIDALLKEIKQVTKADVVHTAKKLKADTVYFLTSKEIS